MSHSKKRSSVGDSRKKHGDDDDMQESASDSEQPQIEQGDQRQSPTLEVEARDMQEEMGKTIERTSVALGHLLQVVESTAQQVGRLAEEQQNSISFFASWHKYLKSQEAEEQSSTAVENNMVQS